ncbi:MAG: cell division protein SepF [Oscillospiraceae bacterium]|nr:cell division protein SepF [Oscillospiraceae bacterium]
MGLMDWVRGGRMSDEDYNELEDLEGDDGYETLPPPAQQYDNVISFNKKPQPQLFTQQQQQQQAAQPQPAPRAETYTREFSSGITGGGSSPFVAFRILKNFNDVAAVADQMVAQRIVILNLESCDDVTGRRVLDFIGGVAHACKSTVKAVAGRVYMITPRGVNADGEFFDEPAQHTHHEMGADIAYEE